MRLLKIDDIIVDIDNETAFGITLQSYDIKQPGNRFINVSNTFSIPKTSNNLSIFGNPYDVQSVSTKIYDALLCNYWIDNEQIIKNAKVKVTEINDRINLFLYEKQDVWTELKALKFNDLIWEVCDWLELPFGTTTFNGSFRDFTEPYMSTTSGLHLPLFLSNLKDYTPAGDTSPIETRTSIYLSHRLAFDYASGGHYTMFVKTIFEYLEYKYGVNFGTAGGEFPGNIWDDEVAPKLQVAARNLGIWRESADVWHFIKTTGGEGFIGVPQYAPLKAKFCDDKTASDFVNVFMQYFNIVKDELFVNGVHTIRMARFDDIPEFAEVVDFTGNISGIESYKPYIEGFAQNNRIGFKSVYEGGDKNVNSKTITCLNKTLDVKTDLFEIDAFIPALQNSDDPIYDMSKDDSYKNFTFFLDGDITTETTLLKYYEYPLLGTPYSVGYDATASFRKAVIYDLNSEYTFLDSVLDYPKYYEIKKWLSISDIRNFRFFKQYYFRELNGSFFVNKIKGYNPEKSKEPTTLELIKISNKTPVTPPNLNYWTDGTGDAWTDGEGDVWY